MNLSCKFPLAVAGFSYYQFYCFQNAADIVSDFQSLNITLVNLVANSTDLVDLSSRICSSTAVVREFIDSQLPWFEYQEYTWLAIGMCGGCLWRAGKATETVSVHVTSAVCVPYLFQRNEWL